MTDHKHYLLKEWDGGWTRKLQKRLKLLRRPNTGTSVANDVIRHTNTGIATPQHTNHTKQTLYWMKCTSSVSISCTSSSDNNNLVLIKRTLTCKSNIVRSSRFRFNERRQSDQICHYDLSSSSSSSSRTVNVQVH